MTDSDRIEHLKAELEGREQRRKYLLFREDWYLRQLQCVLIEQSENSEATDKLEREIDWLQKQGEVHVHHDR